MTKPVTPLLAADAIVELVNVPGRPIVLIERKNPPYGWAIPGGFVDIGETLEAAAIREAKEARVVQTLGLGLDQQKLSKAIAFSSFDTVRRQESASGFRERPIRADQPFFREGRAGGWRDELPRELADKIINDHQDVMRRFGYLDQNNQPVY